MKKIALFLVACLLMSMTTGFMAFAAEGATDIVLRGCDFEESGGGAYAEGPNVALRASSGGYITYKVTMEEAGERYLYMTAGLVRQAKIYVDVNGTNQIQADYRFTGNSANMYDHFLGKVTLNAGDNLVKVYIGVLENDELLYMKSLKFAVKPATIKAVGKTEIPVSSFSKSENYGKDFLHGYGGSVIYLNTVDGGSDYVEYTVYAEEAGRYYFNANAAALRNPHVSVSANGGEASAAIRHPFSTLYGTANLKQFYLGYADLNQGVNTVKIAIAPDVATNNSTLGMTGSITISKDGHALSADGVTTLSQIQYTSSAATPAVDGGAYIALNSTCRTLTYNVVAEEDDVYVVKAGVGTPTTCQGYFTVDGTQVNAAVPSSGSYKTPADMTAALNLKKGVNEVSVTISAGGAYFFGMSFERKAVKLSETETVTLDCGDFISASEGFNHDGFTKDNWATYRVHAPKAGLYYMDIYRGGIRGMLLDIEINGVVQRKASLKDTNDAASIYGENKTSLGVVELNEGYNDIKVTNTKQTFVMHKFDFTPVTGAGERVFFGNEIIESPSIDSQNYPMIAANQQATMNVKMTENGDYALYVFANGFLDRAFDVAVNGKTFGTYTIETETATSTPLEYYVTTLSLHKGQNTITITNGPSGFSLSAVYLRETEITAPDVTYYAGAGDDLMEATTVVPGTMTAKIAYNNMFEGRDVFEAFAIYETDANGVVRLVNVMVGTAEDVSADSESTLVIENITLKENCTYKAKVFTWHEMDGAFFLLGE